MRCARCIRHRAARTAHVWGAAFSRAQIFSRGIKRPMDRNFTTFYNSRPTTVHKKWDQENVRSDIISETNISIRRAYSVLGITYQPKALFALEAVTTIGLLHIFFSAVCACVLPRISNHCPLHRRSVEPLSSCFFEEWQFSFRLFNEDILLLSPSP